MVRGEQNDEWCKRLLKDTELLRLVAVRHVVVAVEASEHCAERFADVCSRVSHILVESGWESEFVAGLYGQG